MKQNRVQNKPASGWPSKLGENDKRHIKRIVQKNQFTSAPKIAAELEKYENTKVSPDIVRRCLKSQGLLSCVPRKKPLINKINRQSA